MGILRFTLAMAVVLGHTIAGKHRLLMIDPAAAVESFFIISGFYMGMILSEKYVGLKSYKLFISNRFLRIFPAYWLVLAGSIGAWMVIAKLTGFAGPLDLFRIGLKPSAVAVLTLVQVLIIGQDIFLFARAGPGGLLIPTAHFQDHPTIWQYAAVPPAWSLSLELYFYCIAPFLVRVRSGSLALVFLCSFGCRLFVCKKLGLTNDPWTYRFFPCELMFFVGGILAYRAYAVVRVSSPPRWMTWIAIITVLALAAVYPHLPITPVTAGFEPRQWLFFIAAFAGMPLMFLWSNPINRGGQKLRQFDKWIGEMSYPIYITHFFFIQMLTLPSHRQLSLRVLLASVIALTILSSGLLLKYVMQPIEQIRKRRADSAQSQNLQAALDVVTP